MNNVVSPDGYQYGVMFKDKSVARRWTGRTQREQAERWLRDLRRSYPNDNITLARRLPGGQWERI